MALMRAVVEDEAFVGGEDICRESEGAGRENLWFSRDLVALASQISSISVSFLRLCILLPPLLLLYPFPLLSSLPPPNLTSRSPSFVSVSSENRCFKI